MDANGENISQQVGQWSAALEPNLKIVLKRDSSETRSELTEPVSKRKSRLEILSLYTSLKAW